MNYLKIAQVLKPQGIKGELKLRAFTDDISRFSSLEYTYLRTKNGYEKRALENARFYKEFVYVKISGCDDRNTAETLRGQFLFVDRENAAPLPEGAHYIVDLEGLELKDTKGNTLGVLDRIIQTGGVDIYSVKGERDFMFPAVPHVVLKKDVDNGYILIDEARLEEVAIYD